MIHILNSLAHKGNLTKKATFQSPFLLSSSHPSKIHIVPHVLLPDPYGPDFSDAECRDFPGVHEIIEMAFGAIQNIARVLPVQLSSFHIFHSVISSRTSSDARRVWPAV
ncbi:hypothetical protein SAMN02745702_02975, partial [Desulfobaculum bizertense DSM 18034]